MWWFRVLLLRFVWRDSSNPHTRVNYSPLWGQILLKSSTQFSLSLKDPWMVGTDVIPGPVWAWHTVCSNHFGVILIPGLGWFPLTCVLISTWLNARGFFRSLGFLYISLLSGTLSCKHWLRLSPWILSSVSSSKKSARLQSTCSAQTIIGLTLFISHFSGTQILIVWSAVYCIYCLICVNSFTRELNPVLCFIHQKWRSHYEGFCQCLCICLPPTSPHLWCKWLEDRVLALLIRTCLHWVWLWRSGCLGPHFDPVTHCLRSWVSYLISLCLCFLINKWAK